MLILYVVDVSLYSHRGEFMEFMPKDKVHPLPELEIYLLTERPLSEVQGNESLGNVYL